MKFFYSTLIAAAALLSPFAANASSKWEASLTGTNALKVYVTNQGRLLSSDYDYIKVQGGIYYSDDHGDTWTKSDVADYFYWHFCESDDYIWAPGFECRVARSEDGGKSWIVLNFEELAKQYLDPKSIDDLSMIQSNSAVYDKEKKRLFVSVFAQELGVIYSDDDGETWKRTNIDGFLINYDKEKDIREYDNIYRVIKFNGKIYALAMFCHYEYDYDTDSWTRITDGAGNPFMSNFLCTTTPMDGTLYASRSMEDENPEKPFMTTTTDMQTWTNLPRPENARSNYVNGICNDGHAVYAASFHDGVFATCDKGQSWTYISKDGFPEADPYNWINEALPTGLDVDDKYLYICLFEHSNPGSGVYRIEKPEVTSVKTIEAYGAEVKVFGKILRVNGAADAEITITRADGAQVLSAHGLELNLESLPAGVYIYSVRTGSASVSGKILL